jgi:four helix bundle protein
LGGYGEGRYVVTNDRRNGHLLERTRDFALRLMKLADALPRRRSADVIGRQLLRSSTSVGANYRAACRARSTAAFIAKLWIGEKEADDSLYRLELIARGEILQPHRLVELQKEANEILAMAISSIRTDRSRKNAAKPTTR